MAIEIKRRPKESTQGLIRRFTQRVRKSGVLVQARRIRFKEEPKSKQAKKKAALRRGQLRERYEELKKLGK
jgi:ribosomal protein S21